MAIKVNLYKNFLNNFCTNKAYKTLCMPEIKRRKINNTIGKLLIMTIERVHLVQNVLSETKRQI